MAEVEGFDKYKGLPQDIAEEIRGYETTYFKTDKPIPFCGLLIYPVTVEDYEIFSSCSTCLTLKKNEDPKGIVMSHLDYLISKTQDPQEGSLWSYKIQKLFEIIFHIKNGLKCKGCGQIIEYSSNEFKKFIHDIQEAQQNNTPIQTLQCPGCKGEDFLEMIKIFKDETTNKYSLLIDGHIITKQDFDRLRQIILFQNFPDYQDDSWVDPEVKKDYEERVRLEAQKNDTHATIEKKIVCLSIATNYKFEDIYRMSIRKFTMALATVDDLINYKITRQAMMSGFVSFPKDYKPEHWIYKPDKDMYGDGYKSTDQVHNDMSNL